MRDGHGGVTVDRPGILVVGVRWHDVLRVGEAATPTRPSWRSSRPSSSRGCLVVLLTLTPDRYNDDVAAGRVWCHSSSCSGVLRPWGFARVRLTRQLGGGTVSSRPRRVRCGGCGRTDVVLDCSALPRRVDSVETVGAALMAAVRGAGHRKIAETIGVPPSTVRDWLRRARTNGEHPVSLDDCCADVGRVGRQDRSDGQPAGRRCRGGRACGHGLEPTLRRRSVGDPMASRGEGHRWSHVDAESAAYHLLAVWLSGLRVCFGAPRIRPVSLTMGTAALVWCPP